MKKESSVLILLGGPGSGKGTHGEALAAAHGYEHLSAGHHFRDEIRRATPLGRRAREFVERGQLVPDSLAGELVQSMLERRARGFVLDGYPRSLAQAEALEEACPALHCRLTQALFLAVSDEEIVRRLSGRLTCRACGRTCHEISSPPAQPGVCDACGGELFRRADDQPETIRHRIAVFHRMNKPLMDFYDATDRLVAVDAEGPTAEVSARVVAASRMAAADS